MDGEVRRQSLLATNLGAKSWDAWEVIDGMAECMSAAGLNEDKADEVLNFIKQQVRPFAEKAGAAVLISDHVTKSWEGRGFWSRGSGAKMGRYDGVSYALTLIDACSPGQAGSVLLTVTIARMLHKACGYRDLDYLELELRHRSVMH